MFTADAIVPLTTLLIGILIGVAGLAAVRWVREETAFTTRFRAALKEVVAKYRTEDGGRVGVLLPMSDDLEQPDWLLRRREGSEAPVPLRVVDVPVVPGRVAVLDRQTPTWPASRVPGAHRATDDPASAITQDLFSAEVARELREAGR